MKLLKTVLQSKLFIILIILFSVIYSLVITNYRLNYSASIIKSNTYSCKVNSYNFDGDRLTMELSCPFKVISYYYFKDDYDFLKKNISYGSNIEINGDIDKISSNTFFNAFNYKRYLALRMVYFSIKINSITAINRSNSLFYRLKNYLYKRASLINNPYMYAFILGNNKMIKDDLDLFRDNGVSHLLALSGMHVSFFSAFLLFFLRKIHVRKTIRYFIVSIILLMFYLINASSISLFRAVLFFILAFLFELFDIKTSNINMLLICFSITLFIFPYGLFDSAFLLSFISVFFLIRFTKRTSSYFKSIIFVSFLSFATTFLLSAYYFGQVNLLSIIFNIFLVPYVSLIVFPLSLLTFLFPFLLFIYDKVIYVLLSINKLFSLCNLIVYYPHFSSWFILLYLVILYLAMHRNKYLLILLFGLALCLKMYPYFDYSYKVFYLDVSQGDSILISYPAGKGAVLIDTGGNINSNYSNIAINKTIPFLRKNGISSIRFLVISHGDYDHMGEAINLVENYKVEKVIFNCGAYNDLEQELIKVLNKKKINYYSCIKELNIDNNKLYFLQTKEYDNENDNSNVIYTELDGYKFMFMGDAGVTTEKEIMSKYNLLDIDILKVGHHGSRTSSSIEFIDKIKPNYSVISVGKNNKYGHPNKEVLNNLENSKIYRTDQDGSIMFKIKNNTLKIETCSS